MPNLNSDEAVPAGKNTLTGKIKKLLRFFTRDIWCIQTSSLPKKKIILLNYLRMFVLTVRGFTEDKCMLRASALTYYTLLSIVPVLAMAFGVAKGFGMDRILRQHLLEGMEGQQEVLTMMLDFSDRLLATTQGGVVAGVGVLVLFYTVVKLLGNIEKSLNDIWGIKEHRLIFRKLSDYLAIMFVCPILVILASSVTVFATVQLHALAGQVDLMGVGPTFLKIVSKLLSLAVVWLLFTFIYLFMPNTRVRFVSGLVAGIIAGTIFQITQWAYVAFQVGFTKYNTVYGSFAALPLFLIWVQASWLILLFGAEIGFAHQNVETYEYEPDSVKASNRFRKTLTLAVLNVIFKRFDGNQPPLCTSELAQTLEVPIRLVRQVIFDCLSCGLLYEIKGKDERAHTYIPGMNIDKVKISSVLEILEDSGADELPLTKSPPVKQIRAFLQQIRAAQNSSPENTLVKDI